MQKRVWVVLFCLLGMINLYCEYWIDFDYQKLTDSEKQELSVKRKENRLRAKEFNKRTRGEEWNITWHENEKYMRGAVRYNESYSISDSLNTVIYVEGKLSQFLPFMGIVWDDLIISKVVVEPKRNFFSVIYKQHVNGVNFDQNSGISVIYSEGYLEIGNSCLADFKINTTPAVSKEKAWDIVKKDAENEVSLYSEKSGIKEVKEVYRDTLTNTSYGVEIYYSAFGTEEEAKSKIQLVIYKQVKQNGEVKDFRLAYRIIVPFKRYYIDAKTGKILKIITPLMQGRSNYFGNVTGEVYDPTNPGVDGNNRIVGSSIDIGAYEYQGN